MMRLIRAYLRQLIRRHRRSRAAAVGARLCRTYLSVYTNRETDDLAVNGEARLASHLPKLADAGEALVVFDVGASVGAYAALLRSTCPRLEAHCFEIVPSIFATLSERFGREAGFVLNDFGLSDREGSVDVTVFPKSTSGASLAALPWESRGMASEQRPARVTTGDRYLEERGVARVHLLKIDTEGHDLAVLRGFQAALAAGRIDAVQFEHGEVSIPSRTLLRDFYDLLVPLGFCIGRLYPDGVEFKDYDPFTDEHFNIGNYVAVRDRAGAFARAVGLSPLSAR